MSGAPGFHGPISGIATSVAQITSERWTCQLVNVDESDGEIILDMLALEACPFPPAVVFVGEPFAIRVGDFDAAEWTELPRSWADNLTEVTIELVADSSGWRLGITDAEGQALLLGVTVQ
jgi:hypothetical protein